MGSIIQFIFKYGNETAPRAGYMSAPVRGGGRGGRVRGVKNVHEKGEMGGVGEEKSSIGS